MRHVLAEEDLWTRLQHRCCQRVHRSFGLQKRRPQDDKRFANSREEQLQAPIFRFEVRYFLRFATGIQGTL